MISFECLNESIAGIGCVAQTLNYEILLVNSEKKERVDTCNRRAVAGNE